MRPPELRSPVARAVLPVAGGLIVLTLIAGFTWAMAAYISSGEVDSSERLAPSVFTVGQVEYLADIIASDGPLLFAQPGTAAGERSIVVDHRGDDPATGWRVRWAFPADRSDACPVTQQVGTDTFTDCEGRDMSVDDLALPDDGVRPVVYDRSVLRIDLRGVTAAG